MSKTLKFLEKVGKAMVLVGGTAVVSGTITAISSHIADNLSETGTFKSQRTLDRMDADHLETVRLQAARSQDAREYAKAAAENGLTAEKRKNKDLRRDFDRKASELSRVRAEKDAEIAALKEKLKEKETQPAVPTGGATFVKL